MNDDALDATGGRALYARPGARTIDAADATPTRAVRLVINAARRRSWLIGFVALAAAAVMLALLVGNALEAATQQRRAEKAYVHTLNVLLVAGELRAAIHSTMQGQRGYLLTGDRQFLEPYHTGRSGAPRLLRRLRSLTADNPSQQSNIDVLDTYLRSYLGVLDQSIRLAHAGRRQAAIDAVQGGMGQSQIDRTLLAVGRIEAEEHYLSGMRDVANEHAARRTERYGYALAAVGALLLLATALTGFVALQAYRRTLFATAELRRLATTDGLTGLLNRRQFLKHLDLEVARTARSGRPVSLAMLDIDHFKRINDAHGHPGGDEVLRAVSQLLRSTTRTGDIVGRLGGEEFAVLMTNTTLEQAEIACERLRVAVAKHEIRLPSGAIATATISTGIALLSNGETVARLVGRADIALYEAKNGGRNQIRLAA